MILDGNVVKTLLESLQGFGFISGKAELIALEEPHSAHQAAAEQGQAVPAGYGEPVGIVRVYAPDMQSFEPAGLRTFGTAVANDDALRAYRWNIEAITVADSQMLDGYGSTSEPGGLIFTLTAEKADDLEIRISGTLSALRRRAEKVPAMYEAFAEAIGEARIAWIEAGRPSGWALPAVAETPVGRLFVRECEPQTGSRFQHVLFICDADELMNDDSLGRHLMTGLKSDSVTAWTFKPELPRDDSVEFFSRG